MALVTSFQNDSVKRARAIQSRKGREREGCFWAEGIHITLEAIETGWPVEQVILCPDRMTSGDAIDAIEGADVEITRVSEEVFRRLSDRDNPTGLGAVLKTAHRSLGAIDVDKDTFIVALDRPRDPGNLGTVIRTVASAGANGLVLVGASTDPYDPRSVRAAMGTLFTLPVVSDGKTDGFLAWVREHDVRLVGSSTRGTTDYREADYTRPVALLLGNEQHGLDETLAAAVDTSVRIPMAGRASSLNLAAAAAILAFTVSNHDQA